MRPHQARALSAVAGIEHTVDDPRFAAQPVFAFDDLDVQADGDLVAMLGDRPRTPLRIL